MPDIFMTIGKHNLKFESDILTDIDIQVWSGKEGFLLSRIPIVYFCGGISNLASNIEGWFFHYRYPFHAEWDARGKKLTLEYLDKTISLPCNQTQATEVVKNARKLIDEIKERINALLTAIDGKA